MKQKNIIVIGSGFAGLSAATHLAHQGHQVTILEKNNQVGGRARVFQDSGFTFDMGPSWYWMPDVFENYFKYFGKDVKDYYDLVRLDPSYRIFYEQNDIADIPAKWNELKAFFEERESGSGEQLDAFMKEAAYKYEVGINKLVHKPGKSLLEFLDTDLMKGLFKLQVFTKFSKHARKFFSDPKLLQLVEFPILFLGATPQDTPALYSLMNYADMKLGTWYPMGGMHKIVQAMQQLAEEKGVNIITGEEVKGFNYSGKSITEVETTSNRYACDLVVSGADYHHTETLLNGHRNYTEAYWNKRVMAPSSLLFYLGVDKKIANLKHHNLFFDEDFNEHAKEIYKNPAWPKKPLFYVCTPSKTDPSVAPEGKENIFVLIPLAPGLQDDTEEQREKYFNMVMDRMEQFTGEKIREHIVYKRSYAQTEFIQDYHAFKGNAYGLANTLSQTAILKPSLKNKNLNNLYYTGQLTVPGPGVPPSLISGKVVAEEILKAG